MVSEVTKSDRKRPSRKDVDSDLTLPKFKPFQLASLADKVPSTEGWLFEMNDGYRCQAPIGWKLGCAAPALWPRHGVAVPCAQLPGRPNLTLLCLQRSVAPELPRWRVATASRGVQAGKLFTRL